MLEEVGQPYDTEILPYDRDEGRPYLAVNPMGKVPAIKHRGNVVTEVAAICCLSRRRLPAGRIWRRAPTRTRRLLPLALLRCGPGRAGVQQQGRRAGNRRPSRAAHVRLRQLRDGRVDARRALTRSANISRPTASPLPTCIVGAHVNVHARSWQPAAARQLRSTTRDRMTDARRLSSARSAIDDKLHRRSRRAAAAGLGAQPSLRASNERGNPALCTAMTEAAWTRTPARRPSPSTTASPMKAWSAAPSWPRWSSSRQRRRRRAADRRHRRLARRRRDRRAENDPSASPPARRR